MQCFSLLFSAPSYYKLIGLTPFKTVCDSTSTTTPYYAALMHNTQHEW